MKVSIFLIELISVLILGRSKYFSNIIGPLPLAKKLVSSTDQGYMLTVQGPVADQKFLEGMKFFASLVNC